MASSRLPSRRSGSWSLTARTVVRPCASRERVAGSAGGGAPSKSALTAIVDDETSGDDASTPCARVERDEIAMSAIARAARNVDIKCGEGPARWTLHDSARSAKRARSATNVRVRDSRATRSTSGPTTAPTPHGTLRLNVSDSSSTTTPPGTDSYRQY